MNCASIAVPHFAWRVTSTRSRYHLSSNTFRPPEWNPEGGFACSRGQLKSWLSCHLLELPYEAPFAITSLTGSLLWALNYAHWLLRGYFIDVKIHLIDTRGIREDRICPATILVRTLNVKRRDKPWHDDPYHEYFVFGGVSQQHILGSIDVDGFDGPTINTLIPGFGTIIRHERLHRSLCRFRLLLECPHEAQVSNRDMAAALKVAAQLHLQGDKLLTVTVMFLALRRRKWDQAAFQMVLDRFHGMYIPLLSMINLIAIGVAFPRQFLYKTVHLPIRSEMMDVVEWVRGMECLRLECVIAEMRQLSMPLVQEMFKNVRCEV